jgi:hypothetical protein
MDVLMECGAVTVQPDDEDALAEDFSLPSPTLGSRFWRAPEVAGQNPAIAKQQ